MVYRRGGSNYEFSEPVNSDITLYAHWSPAQLPAAEQARINFRRSDAAEYIFDGDEPLRADVGSTVTFSLRLSPYYIGEPVVKAGDAVLTADKDGKYSFAVTGDTTVTVGGMVRDTTPIVGLGTSASPYLISNASQLKTVTDAINNPDDNKYNSSYITLIDDIELNGETLESIGNTLNTAHFEGVFDGGGHTVSDFGLYSETGIIGFFGYLVQGEVKNLNLAAADIDIELLAEQNYIIGGVVAYNMGGDVFACSFNGKFTVDFSYADPAVYLGGIVGFTQGYSTDYSATVSYCTVNADIDSIGAESLFAVGGIAGAVIGTAQSAPVNIYNCVYNGDITGNSMIAGGIVGYLRNYSSVANVFSSGSVSAYSADNIAVAGGLIGLAENETAVTFSYTTAACEAWGESADYFDYGDIVGAAYQDGISGIDARKCLLYNSYFAGDEDLTDFATVKSLLGWTDGDWSFVDGKPVVRTSGADEILFSVNFDFSGETVTGEGQDGEELSLGSDNVTIGGYLPVYWVYGGDGMNTFTADSRKISYGYFLDEQHTQRIPAAMMLTQNMKIYVGFADYSAIGGEYFALIGNSEVRLVFDDNGKMTMYSGGMVSNRMYVFDGTKLLIKDAYFANFMYVSTSGASLDTDYYATMDGNTLLIYDNVFFTRGSEIFAYKQNDAMGKWYGMNDEIYTFRADGTGIKELSGSIVNFTYSVNGDSVTIRLGNNTVTARLSTDRRTMQTSDGVTLSVNKFDEFVGTWEAAFTTPLTLTFDGMGEVVMDGNTYNYEISADGTLAFDGYTAVFNADGLIELTKDGTTVVLGRGGSYMGTWTETLLDYSVAFYGINKDGYGTGYDSFGVSFTYVAELNTDGENEYYYITMYYGTVTYGYAMTAQFKDPEMGDTVLALAVYTPSSGMIADIYNMCYVDDFIGSWNGESGLSLSFNGLGAYNVDIVTGEGHWVAVGSVTVTENGVSTSVRYIYDRATGKASFTYNDRSFVISIADGGISVSVDGGNGELYKAPDEFAAYPYAGDGVKLVFNGKSNVGLGRVTVTVDGIANEYDYTVSDGVATVSDGNEILYSAAVDEQSSLLILTPVSGNPYELGLYSSLVGKVYVGAGGYELVINGMFSLDGIAYGTLNDVEVGFIYFNENFAALYSGGVFYYYVSYVDEYNVALYDSYGYLVNVLCVSDGLDGVYTTESGDRIVLDGRSYNALYYAYATLYVDGEQYVYVYRCEEDGVYIYELDRTGSQDRLIKRYAIYTEETDGATAYESADGKTIWLKPVE